MCNQPIDMFLTLTFHSTTFYGPYIKKFLDPPQNLLEKNMVEKIYDEKLMQHLFALVTP